MKAKDKILVNAAVSMAVCASLITGATYALFTSESTTNIAITSGKVAVTAAAEITKVFSAEWQEGIGYNDKELYESEDYEAGKEYSFTNGGTASYTGNTLTLNNISPGDGVEFKITAENNSSISIKYQTVVTFVSGGATKEDGTVNDSEKDSALFHALEINVGDESNTYKTMKDISSNRSTAVSGWSDTLTAKQEIAPITVSIKFPMEGKDHDKLQNQSCKIAIGLYAVQSNGHDTTKEDVFLVTADSNLTEVFDEVEDGGTVVLSEDLTMPEGGLTIGGEKEVNVDLSGNTFGVNKENAESQDLIISEGSSLTVTNSAETAEGEKSTFTVNTNANSNNDTGDREHSSYTTKDKKYTMKVEGELNFEDVDVEVNNKQGDIGICVDGGTVNFEEGTELSINGREATDGYGETGFGKGFYVTNGGEINLNNANVTSEGAVTSFLVGGEKAGTLNIKGGTYDFKNMYNSIIHATFVSAFQTYENGTINITDGAKLQLTGKALNSRAGNLDGPEKGETGYTNMVLLSTIGGGNINVSNSELTVSPELGNAIVVQTVCSYYNATPDSTNEKCTSHTYHRGVQNNSHVTLGEGTKIYLNNAAHDSTSGSEVCFAFAASRNGKQITQYSTDGKTYYDESTTQTPVYEMELAGTTAEEYCTIKVASSVEIYVNYIEGTKENPGLYYKMENKKDGTDANGMQHKVYIYDLGLPNFINRYDPSGILFDYDVAQP